MAKVIIQQQVDDLIKRVVNIKELGAVGNGVTDDTSAFLKAEQQDVPNIFVPSGTYYVKGYTRGNLLKLYYGEGVIKYSDSTLYYVGVSDEYKPVCDISASSLVSGHRVITFIGDSITFGYPVTWNKSYPALLQKIVDSKMHYPMCSMPSFANFNKYSQISGDYSFGTAGPIAKSVILNASSVITLTCDNPNYIFLWYNKSNTTTTVSVKSSYKNITETHTTETGSGIGMLGDFTRHFGASGTTITITNTGSNPVELTGIFISDQYTDDDGIVIQDFSESGYTTENYINDEQLDSITTQSLYTSEANTIVIALGTNDAFSPDASITPDRYKDNLEHIVNRIKSNRPKYAIVIVIPWIPYKGSAKTYKGMYNEYRNSAMEVATKYSCMIFDGAEVDFNSNNDILRSDNLHPNELGYAVLARWFARKLGLNDLIFDPITVGFTPEEGISAEGSRIFMQIKNKRLIFNGHAKISNGPIESYPKKLFTIPLMAQSPRTSYINVNTNPAGSGVVRIENGNVELITCTNNNPDYIFMAGASVPLED